jgi:hypothetical protein
MLSWIGTVGSNVLMLYIELFKLFAEAEDDAVPLLPDLLTTLQVGFAGTVLFPVWRACLTCAWRDAPWLRDLQLSVVLSADNGAACTQRFSGRRVVCWDLLCLYHFRYSAVAMQWL